MTLEDARKHLDRLREGHTMPVSLTTEALLVTGDIPRIPEKPLCFDSNEPTDDRGGEIQNQRTKEGISYSRYLDCTTNKGT